MMIFFFPGIAGVVLSGFLAISSPKFPELSAMRFHKYPSPIHIAHFQELLITFPKSSQFHLIKVIYLYGIRWNLHMF